jgi:hypothetical protein
MTENELRSMVKSQIIEGFKRKQQDSAVSLPEIRLLVREELKKRINESKKAPDADVKKAVDQMAALNSQMAAVVKQAVSKKKSESLAATAAGLLLGLPGLLHLMSKMASFLAKALNKFGGNFDPEKEGETFHHWSEKTHKFYIDSVLVPIAKKVFKKKIGNDEKKARIYGEVLYAVLLAAVAVHAGIEVVKSFSQMGSVVQVAYEAAHGAETGLTSSRMAAGVRAAFAAVNELDAIESIKTATEQA